MRRQIPEREISREFRSRRCRRPATIEATLIFARTGNYVSARCHHAKVQFVKVVPPGDTTALYEGEIY